MANNFQINNIRFLDVKMLLRFRLEFLRFISSSFRLNFFLDFTVLTRFKNYSSVAESDEPLKLVITNLTEKKIKLCIFFST